MALAYDTVTAISQKKFLPRLVDNIFTSNVTWDELHKHEEFEDGGTVIVQPIIYAKGTAESYSGYQVLDTTGVEEFTAAEYNRRHYHRSIVISKDDELKNSGPEQVISMVQAKVKNAEVSLKDKFGDDLFTDGGGTAIDGLADAISATSTYGGIAIADFSGWAATSTTITGNVTLDDISKLIDDLTIGQDRPSILTTRFAIYRRIRNLMQAQQRYGDGKEEKVYYGWRGVMFENIPLVPDHKVPSGEVYALNYNWIHWRPTKQQNFIQTPFVEPTNQRVHVSHIFASGNFTTSQRRQLGKLTGITE